MQREPELARGGWLRNSSPADADEAGEIRGLNFAVDAGDGKVAATDCAT